MVLVWNCYFTPDRQMSQTGKCLRPANVPTGKCLDRQKSDRQRSKPANVDRQRSDRQMSNRRMSVPPTIVRELSDGPISSQIGAPNWAVHARKNSNFKVNLNYRGIFSQLGTQLEAPIWLEIGRSDSSLRPNSIHLSLN